MHLWQNALHVVRLCFELPADWTFCSFRFELPPSSGFSSVWVKSCILCVERSPFSGFCSHRFLEGNDVRLQFELPVAWTFRSFRMEFSPSSGFRSFWFETCVSFVLDSDASMASSSVFSPATSNKLELDIFLDLLGHLRELITYNGTRVRDRYILRLVTFPAANAKEVRSLLRVDQSIYFCEDLHPINTQE